MHPAQHFGEVGDRSAPEQPLHGQEDDVGLRLPSIGLIPQRIPQKIAIAYAMSRLRLAAFRDLIRLVHAEFSVP